MKIAIITVWYNEEDLAPFFLKHYDYVDKIFLYLDTDTNDSTYSICSEYSNLAIRDISFPNGFDCVEKQDRINNTVKELSEYDWIYSLDADEFIFPPKEYGSAEEFLTTQEKRGFNILYAKMYQVYRHLTDKDLDPSKPAIPQRLHGDPDINHWLNRLYVKPIVAKPSTGVAWVTGSHTPKQNGKLKFSPETYFGAHWANVEEKIAIKRRIYGMKMRFSKRQVAMQSGIQNIGITEEKIRELVKNHENDPDVLSPLIEKVGS